ncbi:MAG: response regulator [Candidatus Micrarchaeia archaeon]
MGEEPEVLRLEARVLQAIEQEPEGSTESELLESLGIEKAELETALKSLKEHGAIESRVVGNSTTWYSLQLDVHKKVLIVEDDANINNLEKVSLGPGYEIRQAYEGRDAMKVMREFRPHLVVLDIMLPGVDGLDICATAKKDPELKDTIIIIVSATDAVKNRLKGLRYGADYYIRKPFEPKQLRSLVSIFLKKKGKRFDPLVDLPDEKRISAEVERVVHGDQDFEVTNMRIRNLGSFGKDYGEKDAKTIVRLVSQLLQDKVSEWDSRRGFVGYLGEGEFVVAGGKNETGTVVNEVAREFDAVLQFIYQGKGIIDIGLDDMLGGGASKYLALEHSPVLLDKIKGKREEIMRQRAGGSTKEAGGAYSYEELRDLVGSENVEISIKRTPGGDVRVKMEKKK